MTSSFRQTVSSSISKYPRTTVSIDLSITDVS
jgi:hypothetical protein